MKDDKLPTIKDIPILCCGKEMKRLLDTILLAHIKYYKKQVTKAESPYEASSAQSALEAIQALKGEVKKE